MAGLKAWVATALLAALPAAAITPEGMLSANRYSDAMPNPSGEYALFTVSKYSFETSSRTSSWKILDLSTGDISTWYNGSDISEVVFVGSTPTSILYVNGTNEADDGGVSLYTADLLAIEESAKLVASLSAPFSGLKATLTEGGDIKFVMYTKAYPNGTAFNPAAAETPKSTAKIYSSIYVRHWDTWLTENKNAVFGGTLKAADGSFTFDGTLSNYVTGIANVTKAESPYDQGGPGDYDISPDGTKVVFMTKDVNLPLANYTSTQLYLVPFEGTSADAVPINPRGGIPGYPDAQGATSSPAFSPDSDKLAYVQMNGINYESDRTILYVADVSGGDYNITSVAGKWDRSPSSIKWSSDASTLYVDAADLGRTRVFAVPLSACGDDSYTPKNITDEGAVAGFYLLPNSTVLVSDSKLWSSRDIYTASTTTGEISKYYLQANLVDPELAGLGPHDVSEFYFATNSSDSLIQSWIVYPTGFDPSKKYPLAFLTHGGPQGNWPNGWSVRWNFKVWADQGYVVIAPNPTASTGFGQNLTDAVQGRWGTYPYWDLVHCWQYVNSTLDYVDTDNGIEAGASFGGFMTNWMQGHEMGRWFKALVTHDGVTSTLNQYATEELWFMDHDFAGPFNETSLAPGSPYYDWNPMLYIDNWATPHLVIHNDLDFRLPVSEGILLFNLLQVKGVPSKFLNFPDENHWVVGVENSLVWHREIFGWINYYTGLSDESPF